MKKLISIAILCAGISGLAINGANATNDPMTKSKNFDACTAISNYGWGSHFKSKNNNMDAVLYYDQTHGSGVSGGFGAIINFQHKDAPLIESTCKWGAVTLKWNKPGFKGQLTGTVDLYNARITNVNGIINDVEVHDDLIFIRN